MTKILSLAICLSDSSFSKSPASTSSPPCPPRKNCSTQILGLHPKPRERVPPKSSRSGFPQFLPFSQILGCLSVSCELLATMRLRAFAARHRLPCGGEGSEGRAIAIPRASGAGWAGAWVARPSRERQTATEPPPRRWHGTDFRISTAARKAPPTRGATIAAETAAPRGCWPRDPRSGVADKLR